MGKFADNRLEGAGGVKVAWRATGLFMSSRPPLCGGALTLAGGQWYSVVLGTMRMSSHPAGEERNEPVLRLAGDLDFRTAGPTRTALLQALGQASTGLVVDLSAVGFIDSSGLAVLYEATRLVA